MHLGLSLSPRRRWSRRTGSWTSPPPPLTGEQWFVIADLFPHRPTGGRPRVAPRACLEGILWVLISGARWKDSPERYPVLQRAGDDSVSGPNPACFAKRGRVCSAVWMR